MIQKIYDSKAHKNDGHGHDGTKDTDSTKAHKKYSALYTRLLAHLRAFFCIGVIFHFFKHPRGKRAGEYLYLTLNQCYRTPIPHHPCSPKTTTNLIPKLFLLIFTTEIISINSARITLIPFTFDGDSFYFCPLFHRIQPYLYPFIQT